MSIESDIEEIIEAEYCENCTTGLTCNHDGQTVCAQDEKINWSDAKVGAGYYETATKLPFDAVCNCGKYEFDEDMREYIEYELLNPENNTGGMDMKTYCTQNEGDCETCGLVNYGKDCKNNGMSEDE